MSRMFYFDSFEIDLQKQQQLKLIRLVLGYAMENSGQNVIQYFYQEKYMIQIDQFVFVKAAITLGTTLSNVFKLGSSFKKTKSIFCQ